MNLNECTGYNIRKYRLAYQMTLKELAEKINKSVSTVSKYEKGIISLDITTLSDLATIFQISPIQLLIGNNEAMACQKEYAQYSETRYMYTYDSWSKCVVKSIIERFRRTDTDNEWNVEMFNSVKNMHDPSTCCALYTGSSEKKGFIETYTLKNQKTGTEQVLISCVDNLVDDTRQIGILSGLSNRTMFPASMKTVISSVEIKDEEELKNLLRFSKDELQYMKKYGYLTIQNFI